MNLFTSNLELQFHTTSKYSLPLWHYLGLIDIDIRLQIFYRQHLNNSWIILFIFYYELHPFADWTKIQWTTVSWNYTYVVTCLLISYLWSEQIRTLHSSIVCHNPFYTDIYKKIYTYTCIYTLYIYSIYINICTWQRQMLSKSFSK